MQRHWRTVAPPLNVSLAAYIGFKPKAKPKAIEDLDEAGFAAEMRELEGFFAGMG